MKVLLAAINAKYIHSNLAIYSLRAYAREYRKQIVLGEFTINHSKDYILEQIYKEKPDVLCFSCYIWNISYVREIVKEFHKLCPAVPIWVGGPEVSYETQRFLQENPSVTGIMVGEGEETFLEVCQHYDGKKRLEDVKGLAYFQGDTYIQTPMRQAIDMSSIPFCYEDMTDFSNRIIYYESSRGCPFSCSYCLSSVDKHLRFRDIELVKKELLFFIEQKVAQVKFVDRTFNCKHSHAMEIWSFIKEHDNGITNFHFEVSADLLTKEELALISDMRPGLIQLEIGVQSTNEVTIEEIHRTMKLDRLKAVVREIQEGENIHEHLDLIAGLPYEDYKSFARSFDEIYELKPNQLQLGFLKVLKGSYMYEHATEYGMIYHDTPPYEVLATNWLSFDEVLRIKQVEEMLEVYYNSGQFEKTIHLMELLFDSPFDLYQSLGEFYEEKGYFSMSHSRIRRCEILLEYLQYGFVKKQFKELQGWSLTAMEELFKEALTFDLYYRENCKSRPSWALDMSSWKRESRQFCPNGKLSHLELFHYKFPHNMREQLNGLPERERLPRMVLFHYDKRNPLDNQATIEYIMQLDLLEDYTVIDLEMTGLAAKNDQIIEIGAAKVRKGKVVKTLGCLVNPECPIPEQVTNLTGITNEMVKAQGQQKDQAMEELFSFLGDDVILGQNVNFDYGFLKQWAANKRRPLECYAVDTLKIARSILPKEQKKDLESLCSYYGVARENAHRALDDAMETHQVFICLKESVRKEVAQGSMAITEAEKLFEPKLLTYKAKRQTPVTSHQLEQLREYRSKHNITEEINWDTLTRNEASRIMDRYFAKYGRK